MAGWSGLLGAFVVVSVLFAHARADDTPTGPLPANSASDRAADNHQTCREWFYYIQDDMMSCKDKLKQQADVAGAPLAPAPALSSAFSADGSPHCPQECRIILKQGREHMPSFCLEYIIDSLPAKYQVANESALEGPVFDVCESILCPNDTCDERIVDPAVIDALSSFFWLADPGNPIWDNNGGGGISVGAIVGIVFACNIAVVATVTAVVLVIRRRKRQRRLQQGSELPRRPGKDKSAASMEAGLKGTDGSGLAGSDVSKLSKLGLSSLPSSPTASISHPSLTASLSPVGTALTRSLQPPGTASLGLPPMVGAPQQAQRSDVDGGPPAHADGLQGVAALWANALQTTGGGSAPRTPAGSAPDVPAVLTQHMQQDELEMMQLGSNPASVAAASDPSTKLLMSYIASRQQQQQQQQQEQQPGAAGDGGPVPSGDLQPQPATGGGREGEQAPQLTDGDVRASLSADALPAKSSSTMIDLQPWRIDFSSLQIMRPLGEGSYGKVYLARWNETLVAVKVLVSGSHQQGAEAAWSVPQVVMDALENEAQVMATLRHPNIVQFLGICSEPPAIITEYASHGSLLDVLRGVGRSGGLTWVRRLSMALDAAKGMLALHAHSPPILHRDLKSANLLVDSAWKAKVADFNLSKIMDVDASLSSTGHGMLNPRWLAPEVLRGERATAKSDVFSMGVVLWELLTYQIPWEKEGRNSFQLVHMVSSGERLQVPPRESAPGPDRLSESEYAAYVALMQRCWAQEPAERPGFDQIISQLRSILAKAVPSSGSQAEVVTPSAP